MKDVITNKQGHCPYCESKDVEFQDVEAYEDCIDRFYICNDCSESFREEYTFIYKESIGDRQIEE